MDYITSELIGPGDAGGGFNSGLGNILFQIATILSLSKDNNAQATFPKLKDPKYSGFQNNILKNLNTTDHHFTNRYVESSLNYNQLPYKPNTTYFGYFQSERYFSHNREFILSKILNDDVVKDVSDRFSFLQESDTLSIHIRRGDYLVLQHVYNLLSVDYYSSAVNRFNYNKLIVFSDDIEWCKSNLNFKNMIFMESNKEYIDLIAMSLCKNNIISNSSFSWWGAWLNRNENKIVISPSTWFNPSFKEYNSNDIIPETWLKI